MTKRRIRVMLVSPLPPPVGGIATWTARILRAPTGDDIERIHADTSIGDGYGAKAGIARVVRQLTIACRVLWQIVERRPDVIHVTTSYDRGWRRDTLFLALARALGSATILNFRGGDFSRMYDQATPMAQAKMRAQLARCDAVVAITRESERFLKHLELANVLVIPNCIDVTSASKQHVRDGTIRWLFVGHVIKAKGIVQLLDALRQFSSAHLTIVGPANKATPDDGAALLAEANANPAIAGRFTHTDGLSPEQTRAVYPNHDLFVFPSRREGFPNAVLEAMEAGLPIVATRVGAIPDMIVDSEHGLLVEPDDQSGLERAIARVSTDADLAERMGHAARARVSSDFEVGSVASIWCELYRRVAMSARHASSD